jgi:hypothetical protein
MHTNQSHSPKLAFGKLTKAFLFAAPAGRHLVSYMGWPAIFEEKVAESSAERTAQWKRIVAVGANGRHCYLYDSREDSVKDRAWIAKARAERIN